MKHKLVGIMNWFPCVKLFLHSSYFPCQGWLQPPQPLWGDHLWIGLIFCVTAFVFKLTSHYFLSVFVIKSVKSWWNFYTTFRWTLSQTRPNQTIPNQSIPNQTLPNQTIPNQTNFKSSLKQPKQVGSWWNFQRAFRWRLSQTKPYHTIPNQL